MVDAPYVVLRVCSLLGQTKVVAGQHQHVAVIPTSACQMKVGLTKNFHFAAPETSDLCRGTSMVLAESPTVGLQGLMLAEPLTESNNFQANRPRSPAFRETL